MRDKLDIAGHTPKLRDLQNIVISSMTEITKVAQNMVMSNVKYLLFNHLVPIRYTNKHVPLIVIHLVSLMQDTVDRLS